MKKLKELLTGLTYKIISGNADTLINDIVFDSRKVQAGCLFAAIRGTQVDGHRYISQAVDSGAKCIVCEETPEMISEGVTYIKVEDSAYALSVIAANFYDHSSCKLNLIGVTGTNGKTTVATLLYYIFSALGYKCGLLSTIRVIISGKNIDTNHTTPDSVSINRLLHEMVTEGCDYCFMEVSSHAVDQKRISGLQFKGGIFTNITHDHLDYHLTFDNYITAKKGFFDMLGKDAFALVNGDDIHSPVMLQNTAAAKYKFAIYSLADFRAKIIESGFDGLFLELDGWEFHSPRIGKFNAYNLLAVYSAARLLGVAREKLLEQLSMPMPVDGRFEIYKGKGDRIGIVDYAHTPDALENVLKTIVEANNKKKKIITVFGCGGNRDKTKRPKMGYIAAYYSDHTIITSDNPRFEEPEEIIRDIEQGLNESQKQKTLVIPERETAIKTACSIATDGDIILIAGKGHENYQEIKGVKYPFNDKIILTKYLS